MSSAMAIRGVFRTDELDKKATRALQTGGTFHTIEGSERRVDDLVVAAIDGDIAPTVSFDRTVGDRLLVLRPAKSESTTSI